MKTKEVHEFDNGLRQPGYVPVQSGEVVIKLDQFLCQLASSVELVFREPPNVPQCDLGIRMGIYAADEQKRHDFE